MSLPDYDSSQPRGVLVPKPQTNIYTVLLGLTAAALTVGCILLALEIWQYGPIWELPWNVPVDLR